MLEAPTNMAEVKSIVWKCNGSKAPDSDGYNFNFYKRWWNIVWEEVLEFVADFMLRGKLENGLNSTFITLIPKT